MKSTYYYNVHVLCSLQTKCGGPFTNFQDGGCLKIWCWTGNYFIKFKNCYLLNYSQFRNTRKRLWFRVNDNRVNKYCISHFIHCFRYLTNYQLLATSSSCPNYPPPPPVITSLLPPHDVCEVMATCHWLLQNKPNKVKCDYKVLHKFYKPIWCDTKIDFHNSENAHSSNTLTCICLSVISYCQP